MVSDNYHKLIIKLITDNNTFRYKLDNPYDIRNGAKTKILMVCQHDSPSIFSCDHNNTA